MKGMFDSAATFKAYATIDAGIFMLEQIQRSLSLGQVTDKEHAEGVVRILSDIRDAKIIIGADYTQTTAMIDTATKQLKAIKDKK